MPMDFGMYPPEVNSGRMYAGPGPGSLMTAVTAWDRLAVEFGSVSASYGSVIAELGAEWTGPSATTMSAAIVPYLTWMRATAVTAEQSANQARAAVAAYESAFAQTVAPPVVAANRGQLKTLIAGNVLGQNTAAIAVTEAAYAEMWAQDALAMYGYAGAAAGAATLTPFAPPPQTTNPAGSTDQAAAAGQAAGTAAASQAQHAVSALPGAVEVPALLESLSTALPAAGMDPAMAIAYAGLASSLFGAFVIDTAGTFGVDVAGSFGIDLIGLDVAALLGGGAGLVNTTSALPAVPTVSAGLGQASSLSGLSVPQAWTVKAPPPIQHVSASAALSGTDAAPEVEPGGSGLSFAELATAGVAARAIGTMGLGRGAAAKRRHPAEQTSAAGRITKIGSDLRELAELRGAGLLTDEEFAAEKRLLLGH